MSRFHLTVSSNSSMDYYPENTVVRFTMKLLNNIDLDGEWKVGLSETSVPSHVHNVFEGLCYYDIYLANTFIHRINLTPGQIPLQSKPLLVEFSHESDSRKVKMAVHLVAYRSSSVWTWLVCLVTTTTCVMRRVIRGCRNLLRI